jgi:hypothetical protein
MTTTIISRTVNPLTGSFWEPWEFRHCPWGCN